MTGTQLSDAEWKVMHAVWADAPTTARRVLQALEAETRWKYSTVKTMLDRLVDKGVLTAAMEGITTVYQPSLSREEAQKSAMHALADKAFEGTVGSLVHFLVEHESLSAKERRELERLLASARRRRSRS